MKKLLVNGQKSFLLMLALIGFASILLLAGCGGTDRKVAPGSGDVMMLRNTK